VFATPSDICPRPEVDLADRHRPAAEHPEPALEQLGPGVGIEDQDGRSSEDARHHDLRSDWAVSFRAPLFFMVPSPLSLAASRLLRRLQLLEHRIEALEISLPESAVGLQPSAPRRLSSALW